MAVDQADQALKLWLIELTPQTEDPIDTPPTRVIKSNHVDIAEYVFKENNKIRDSLMVRMGACRVPDRGSIPRRGEFFWIHYQSWHDYSLTCSKKPKFEDKR